MATTSEKSSRSETRAGGICCRQCDLYCFSAELRLVGVLLDTAVGDDARNLAFINLTRTAQVTSEDALGQFNQFHI
jgi:hypothetical protein